MRQRLARFGGFPAFLLALGFSVTGWTNPAVGIALMVLSALWAVIGLAGPPIAYRAKEAIVTGVAQELQVALDASQGTQDADRRRRLKGVTQRMLGELTVARERLDEAQRRKTYWAANVYRLSSDEWGANHTAVSDDPELWDHYMGVRLAFEELNRVNTIVIDRQSNPLYSSTAVDASDRLQDAIDRVDEGIRRLRLIVDSL